MPWNGSGVYALPAATFPEVNGTVIDAARYNPTLTDIQNGITAAVAKNGENVPTSNLPMGGFKHTGAAAAAATGQYVIWGQDVTLGALTAGASSLGALTGTSATFSGAVALSGAYTNTVQKRFNVQRITTTQDLPAAVKTTIIFNGENTDIGAGHDSATGIYTAPTTGFYQFSAGIFLQNNAAGGIPVNGIYFSINNSDAVGASRYSLSWLGGEGQSINAASNPFWATGAFGIQLTAGDTVRVKFDNGAATFIMTLKIGSYFTGYFLG